MNLVLGKSRASFYHVLVGHTQGAYAEVCRACRVIAHTSPPLCLAELLYILSLTKALKASARFCWLLLLLSAGRVVLHAL